MTGWRLGYMGASLAIAKACDKMQGQFTSATCSIAQRAAIAALDSPLTTTMTMKAAFQKRRDLVYELIKEIPGFITNKPAGAFYFFPDVTYYFGKKHAGGTINNAEDLCMYLLTEANVAVVSGDSFGSPNNIRFSYATTEENLRIAMQRIKVELAKLV
jgi:aspartate aminotransferase